MTDAVNRPSGMPAPVVAPINEGMWRAAGADRLDVQRCTGCGAHRYPPSDGCTRCSSLEWEWSSVPGTGTIYTYSWVPDRARSAEHEKEICYNVAVVTLDGTEGDPVRILSNVIDAWEPGDLQVGQAVELACVPFAEGVGLPCFRTVR
ncbi:MAG: OB-fold domain-containing protein [Acidimicrobiaceae bacterium]|nr:OB-fold domain-containing protein [Acidimicrobiaceae bacterium]